MFASLMRSRRFAPIFWCQFFSAFNDNFLKNALAFLALYRLGLEEVGPLAVAVFMLPSFLLSGLGGQWADRYDKALVARRLKFAEIGIVALAVAGFLAESLVVLFVALLLFGVVSALFSPIKYGILPDHLAEEDLPAANALVEAATFLAILCGTVAGGLVAARGANPAIFAVLVVSFAVLSWLASRAVPPTAESVPTLKVDWNVFASTKALLDVFRGDRRLWRCALAVAWFWAVGGAVLSIQPVLVKSGLGGAEVVGTAFLLIFAIGIAMGSVVASLLSGGRANLLLVPIGGVIMALFMLDIGFVSRGLSALASDRGLGDVLGSGVGLRLAVDSFGLSLAGGLFAVPSFVAVQMWSAMAFRARTIAATNVLTSGLIAVGGGLVFGAVAFGLTPSTIFLALGVASLGATVLAVRFLPVNVVRDTLAMVFRLAARVEVKGLENLKKAGPGAIIAVNHVSYVDAALALSLLDHDAVFAIDRGIISRWWVKPFLRFTRALPIDPGKPMATRALINEVKSGETLIIFPEGRLTVTGGLMKVYDGAGLIAERTASPVVPVRIDGLEQTLFTRLGRDQARRRLRPRVTVSILEPVRLTVPEGLVGRKKRLAAGSALYNIMSDLVFRTTPADRTLVEGLIAAAKRHGPGAKVLDDPSGTKLSYRRLIAGANILGRRLANFADVGGAVGLMLPNANGAALAIVGLISAGRVPAMINYTAGAANILAACRAAKVTHVATSRAFIEKAKLDPLVAALGEAVTLVYLEDVRAKISGRERLLGLARGLRPLTRRKADDPAVILFTSGSEGTPKGVVLSHRNILSNVAQAAARIDFGRRDRLFAALPLFHSFGLTVGFFLPMVSGVSVFLYPSPLHYRMVPELIYGTDSTILISTDTFLTGYARSANPYDFRSLRLILAGAEPVREATRKVYMERFGARILEGYGVTETSPALSFNTPMYNRPGTVGRLMPGIEARLDPVPGIAEGGRLQVRSPTVMLGYLRSSQPGVLEAPAEGWHDTGDIVSFDTEGFMTIRGRAKRFAKVGGEMISLAAVEALIAELYPDHQSAVTAVEDPRKGERLVLVTEAAEASRATLGGFARRRGASELMVPAEIMVIDKLPVLGSGKVDHVAVARYVAENRAVASGSAA
ncbi:MAG: acyl-[ACP]--phospholipid O-acyltransferase [Bauldia sp.]